MTAKRLWNAQKIYSSYYYSRLTKSPEPWGLPISMSVEPTTACNLRCPECPSGLRDFTRPTGSMDVALFEKIIDEVAEHLMYLTFYFQGEPFIHPKFLEMVKLAAQRNVFTNTSTNGHFIDEKKAIEVVKSGLSRMIISVDGTTQETYEQYRVEGELSKAVSAIENMVAAKKELGNGPEVVIQFLVVKPNEHQIPEILEMGKKLGVDEVLLKTAQIYNYQTGSELIPDQDQYSRYRRLSDGSWDIKNKLENHCWKMWSSSVITWDGRVVPCCFDKNAEHEMGDLRTQQFSEVWNDRRYRAFRASILRSRSEVEMCQNCSEGTQVWA